jgi:hypothetical protein
MNTAANSPCSELQEAPQPAIIQSQARADCRADSACIWENAWIDCLVQACVAMPWIIVGAIGRQLLPGHP